jgi:hypothetical protein
VLWVFPDFVRARSGQRIGPGGWHAADLGVVWRPPDVSFVDKSRPAVDSALRRKDLGSFLYLLNR